MDIVLFVVDDEEEVHHTIADFVREFRDISCTIIEAYTVEGAELRISEVAVNRPDVPIIAIIDHFLDEPHGHTNLAEVLMSALEWDEVGLILTSAQYQKGAKEPMVNALHANAKFVEKIDLLARPEALEKHIKEALESVVNKPVGKRDA